MGSVEKKKDASNKEREVTNNMSKDTILSVRISKQEKGKIRALAKAKGMTESAYVRFMLSQKPSDYPEIIQVKTHLTNMLLAKLRKHMGNVVRKHTVWRQNQNIGRL